MTKYKEIFKLKAMLESAEIPFDFIDHTESLLWKDLDDRMGIDLSRFEKYQICYPSNDDRWVSVIEGQFTYGAELDRLEIMGGITPYEEMGHLREKGDVLGNLTAKQVFKRISDNYKIERSKKDGKKSK